MKKKSYPVIAGLMLILSLTACGTDPELTRFKKDMDDFCTAISNLDASINNINAEDENAPALLLQYLDKLDAEFQTFAAMDFPEGFDYLEPRAKEAGEYMSTAVKSYHEAYNNGTFHEELAAYARENSARAFKRVQVIIMVLHGDDPHQGVPTPE